MDTWYFLVVFTFQNMLYLYIYVLLWFLLLLLYYHFLFNWSDLYTHIFQGNFTVNGTIVKLFYRIWVKSSFIVTAPKRLKRSNSLYIQMHISRNHLYVFTIDAHRSPKGGIHEGKVWFTLNGIVGILTKLLSLATLKVVSLTNFGAASEKNFVIMMIFLVAVYIVLCWCCMCNIV